MEKWAPFTKTVSDYCLKQGYDHLLHDEPIDTCDLTYQKPKLILNYIDKYDYIMWADGDVMIANDNIKLESIISEHPEKDLIACKDPGGWYLNAGSLIFKNSPSSVKLLERWWELRDRNSYGEDWRRSREGVGDAHDQSTLISLLGENGGCDPNRMPFGWDKDMLNKFHIYPLEEAKFNSHPKFYKEGGFIIHFMGYCPERVAENISFWDSQLKSAYPSFVQKSFLSHMCDIINPNGYGEANMISSEKLFKLSISSWTENSKTELSRKIEVREKLPSQWWPSTRIKKMQEILKCANLGCRDLSHLISQDVKPSDYQLEKESDSTVILNDISPIALSTLHGGNTRNHGIESETNIFLYAQKHGFTGYSTRSNPFPDIHPCWAKWKILSQIIERHEYIVWVDADALIVNDEWNIANIINRNREHDIVCPSNFDSSVFIIKNTDESKKVIESMCKWIDKSSPKSFLSKPLNIEVNDDYRQIFKDNRADDVFKLCVEASEVSLTIDPALSSPSSSYSRSWAVHFSDFSDDQKFLLMKNFNKIISRG